MAAEKANSPGISFGITTDTKSVNLTPFSPTEEHPITVGYLVKVEPGTLKIKATEEEKDVLNFTFKNVEKDRTFTHVEWAVADDDENYAKKLEGMQVRLKHIYETYQPVPSTGIGGSAKDFKGLFFEMAKAFNTNGKDNTPIFTDIKVWIKVVYPIKSKGQQLQFPLSPNFIERFRENKKTLLFINKQYETLVQKEGTASATKLGSVGDGEFPVFQKS